MVCCELSYQQKLTEKPFAKNANYGIPNAKFNYRRLKWKSSFE
jgi:hypothetical protein